MWQNTEVMQYLKIKNLETSGLLFLIEMLLQLGPEFSRVSKLTFIETTFYILLKHFLHNFYLNIKIFKIMFLDFHFKRSLYQWEKPGFLAVNSSTKSHDTLVNLSIYLVDCQKWQYAEQSSNSSNQPKISSHKYNCSLQFTKYSWILKKITKE